MDSRKAIWISKSSALIEDARRDWCALGGSEKDIIDLSNIKLGAPIQINEGVLFATYSTLRSQKGYISRHFRLRGDNIAASSSRCPLPFLVIA
ncbi:strawberry notch-like NTP hydrolase domain-containing protein [Nostoc sp.]